MLAGALELPCDVAFQAERKEGRLETQRQIAKKMKKAGKSLDEIMEFTDLTVDEIEKV